MTSLRTDQVFIVGMNGSGTTMLLDCLANHSMLFGFPGETKVLPYFLEREEQYGDLTDEENLRRLTDDFARSLGGRYIVHFEAVRTSVSSGSQPGSVAVVFDQFMKRMANAEGKAIWCEKTPMYVHHLSLLASAFPRAKFVHVIRDGRECAASFHRRWHFNPVRTAYRWKRSVRAGRTQGAFLGSRYYEIRYEDMTTAPEQYMRQICTFLGIPFEPAVVSLARSRPHMTGSSALSIVPNERRADLHFDSEYLERMEAIAGICLRECGYVTHYSAGDSDPSMWTLRWWEMWDNLRRLGGVARTVASMRKSARWSYVVRRLSGSLKQKRSLKS